MKKLLVSTGIVVFFLGMNAFTSPHLPDVDFGKWIKLGSKQVNYALDRDEITVGAKEGGFRKLKVEVTGGAINMHKMTVVYGNGTRDELEMRHNFRQGSNSRVLDLEGGKRIIKKIIFWYDTKNLARKRAQVTVFGKR